jgi:hypothetical protein
MATKLQPRVSILDRRFKYRDSANTDVRRTWRRARLVQRLGAKPSAVVPIRKKGASC